MDLRTFSNVTEHRPIPMSDIWNICLYHEMHVLLCTFCEPLPNLVCCVIFALQWTCACAVIWCHIQTRNNVDKNITSLNSPRRNSSSDSDLPLSEKETTERWVLTYSEHVLHVYQFSCLFFVGDTLDSIVIERDGWRHFINTSMGGGIFVVLGKAQGYVVYVFYFLKDTYIR